MGAMTTLGGSIGRALEARHDGGLLNSMWGCRGYTAAYCPVTSMAAGWADVGMLKYARKLF